MDDRDKGYEEYLQQKQETEIIFGANLKYDTNLEQWYYKHYEIHYEEVQHIILGSILEELTKIRFKLSDKQVDNTKKRRR